MSKKLILLFITLSFQSLYLPANKSFDEIVTDNDSTKIEAKSDSIHLKEVVVRANDVLLENGKAVFIPTKQIKNVAQNISALIKALNTGLLTVDDGKIKTINGESVSLYINGSAVDQMENATFWAKNVIKVEYIPISDDPQFQGRNNVINIVMKEYSSGGLTRFAANQDIPNNGMYNVASKLAYRKMMFNVLVKSEYNNNSLSGESAKEHYKDIWYNETPYKDITRTQNSSTKNRRNTMFAGINARYTDKKFTATHLFTFNWDRVPELLVSGKAGFNPNIISGDNTLKSETAKYHSYSLKGNYLYKPDGKTWFMGIWRLSLGNNKSESSYQAGMMNSILNNVNENFHNGMLSLACGYSFSKKIYASFTIDDNFESYSTFYTGNENSHQKQFINSVNIIPYLYYKPISSLVIKTYPSLSLYSRKINDRHVSFQYMPGINLNANYTINTVSSLDFQASYTYSPTNPSFSNDLILRQTELKWIEGTPAIKTPNTYGLYLNYFVMPVKWLIVAASGTYNLTTQQTAIDYRAGGKEYDGVIGQYVNGLNEHYYSLDCNLSFRPLNGMLSLMAAASYYGTNVSSRGNNAILTPRFSASYNFGNWMLGTSINGPAKISTNCGTEIIKTDWNYDFEVRYGNGNLNFGVEFANIFGKYRYANTLLSGSSYSYNSKSWQRGRCIKLSLTYTFDYGKKIDKRIDISESGGKNTSVLGSK